MKKIQLYCPSHFEVPSQFRTQTKIFGMGRKNAEKLAAELSALSAAVIPVVFGCAGALRKELTPGKAFLITKLGGASCQSTSGFPEASLSSSEVILKTPEEKKKFGRTTQADLVDQEMEFIWKASPGSVQDRIVFFRGVIDGAEDDISFLGPRGPRWGQLISPLQLFRFLKFIGNWRRYLKGMDSTLHMFLRYFPPTP